jgi:hypothetical protein
MKQVAFIFILFILSGTLCAQSQNIGVGASAIYNFQTESFGVGARVNIFPNERISIVPQGSYYFAFNKVEEYLLGVGVEYKFIKREKFNLYVLGHGAYNSWNSYQNSEKKGAKLNNWNAELGLGISTNTCLRPFLEYRYNFKFYETHLQLGVLYIFGCRKCKKSSVDRCSAYF